MENTIITMNIRIRTETEADFEPISKVTEQAFLPMSFSNGDEVNVIERLRATDSLTLSLVATLDETLVGHIAFSPATLDGIIQDWYALGPVAVLPRYQGVGIGSDLINTGMKLLREMKAQGCILTGNPAYYCKFGFKITPELAPAGEPKEYFMIRPFLEREPCGIFAFNPAFYKI